MQYILECHSRSNKQYSAFYARLPDGRSIETVYQSAKRDADGQLVGKGVKPAYLMICGEQVPCGPELRHEFYRFLWSLHFAYNPERFIHACEYDQFHDLFSERSAIIDITDVREENASTLFSTASGCNQARAIAQLVWMRQFPGSFWETDSAIIELARERYIARYPLPY